MMKSKFYRTCIAALPACMFGALALSPAQAQVGADGQQIEVEEVVVLGRLESAAQSIVTERMTSETVMDILGSEQIERIGDSTVAVALKRVPGLTLIERPQQEAYVASSFQFLLLDWAAEAVQAVVAGCAARGVELKWFGTPEPTGFTSRYDSWRYASSEPMPRSDRILQGLLDMRLPLTFSEADCAVIAGIVREEVGVARLTS